MYRFLQKAAARPAEVPETASSTAARNVVEQLELHFSEHYAPLYRFLRASGAGEATAEDLAQDAFLKLHRHLVERKPTPNVRAWLFKVSYRMWIDRQREERRESSADGTSWDSWQEALADPSPGAEHEILAQERRDWLLAAIGKLSQMERQCLHLRADGLQYREIAEVLNVGYWPVVEAVRRALEVLGEQAHGR